MNEERSRISRDAKLEEFFILFPFHEFYRQIKSVLTVPKFLI